MTEVKFDLGAQKYAVLEDGRVVSVNDSVSFTDSNTGDMVKAQVIDLQVKSGKKPSAYMTYVSTDEPHKEVKISFDSLSDFVIDISTIEQNSDLGYEE